MADMMPGLREQEFRWAKMRERIHELEDEALKWERRMSMAMFGMAMLALVAVVVAIKLIDARQDILACRRACGREIANCRLQP